MNKMFRVSKKLTIDRCEDCKHIHKGYVWEEERGEIYLIVIWTCSKKLKCIRKINILANEIIEADFNKQKFEEDTTPFLHYIPEWCPLEDG